MRRASQPTLAEDRGTFSPAWLSAAGAVTDGMAFPTFGSTTGGQVAEVPMGGLHVLGGAGSTLVVALRRRRHMKPVE
jgi:hypothetical protein